MIDGLAFGVLPEAAEALRETHPLIALVHHPLALETGVTPAGRRSAARERARGARLHARRDRHQPGDRAHARGRLRRAARSASRSRRPARIVQKSCGEIARSRAAPAGGRRRRAAQGLRRADRGARPPARPAVAAHHRGRLLARSADRRATQGRYRAAPARRRASPSRTRSRPSAWPRFTPRPTCSCCPRAMRASAWPTPRRSRMACR